MRARDAVRAGVAAADDDHVPARRADRRLRRARDRAVAPVQVLHREVDAAELAAGHGEIARNPRAGGEDGGVEARERACHLGPELEDHALVAQLLQPTLDDGLLDLEVGHAEAEETAAGLVALEHRDRMARARELLRRGEARRPGADDGHALARALRGGARDDPTLVPAAVDDRPLDLLDRHRIALVDLVHACRLARRGAEAARELGEVVRAVQLLERLPEAVAIHEVVPVRDEVPERAAAVAERHAALHAARALLRELALGQRLHELAVVVHALGRRALGCVDPLDLEEPPELAHQAAAGASDSVITKPSPPLETEWSSG